MSQKRVDDYKVLSNVYSHLMKSVNYRAWAKYINLLVKEYLPENPKILELASGNCKLAKHLKKYYHDILVSDLSLNMLKSESNFSGKKICCDMISLPVKEKYDLVICAFDSINYLTSKIKIIKLFEEVKNLMHPNSFFVFDASMLSNSIKSSKNKITKGRVGSIHYSQQSTFNIKTRIHKNKFKIHYPDGNEFTETHRQKIYDFDFYFFAAEKSGLYVSECFDAFSFREAKYYNERVQFILRKNESNVNIR